MYAATGGENMKVGAQILNVGAGAGTTGVPACDGPAPGI